MISLIQRGIPLFPLQVIPLPVEVYSFIWTQCRHRSTHKSCGTGDDNNVQINCLGDVGIPWMMYKQWDFLDTAGACRFRLGQTLFCVKSPQSAVLYFGLEFQVFPNTRCTALLILLSSLSNDTAYWVVTVANEHIAMNFILLQLK